VCASALGCLAGGPGDGYQGINSVFVSPSGQAFELQFHTPESLSMKEEECHSSYAKFRTATDSRKMMQYWEEMVSMWDMVPVPEGVLEIPQVVQQKLVSSAFSICPNPNQLEPEAGRHHATASSCVPYACVSAEVRPLIACCLLSGGL
jgi:hypothetical protein